MNRRNFLIAGLSLATIATVPAVRTLAQGKLDGLASEEELGRLLIAQEKKPNSVLEKKEGRLTTHVLDVMSGKPAAGMHINFSVLEGDRYRLLKTVYTNKDGRTDEPLLIGSTMAVGRYEQMFYVADYYTKLGVLLPNPPFLDEVPLRFAIFDVAQNYHVPLLCTPWSYTTYRGS